MADLLTTLYGILTGQQPAPAGGIPLPARRPDPTAALRPEDFAIPNPLSNFDPQTGMFRGSPTAPVVPLPTRRPEPEPPPLPMRRPEPAAPPLPMRRPETAVASAPPPPTRRPGLPNVPGIVVDNAPPAAGDDLVSELQRIFTAVPTATGMNPMRAFDAVGGPAQGTPQPPLSQPASDIQTAAIGPFETTVTPAQSGPTITGQDVARFFRSLAQGAAMADPTAPPVTAFAQGMAGSMVGRRKEEQEEEAARLKGEERELERQFKTAEQRRAEAKEAREARRAEIENTKTVTEIMRNIGGDLTPDMRLRVEQAVNNYARAINPNGILTEEELRPRLETYRDQLVRDLTGRTQAAAPAGPRQPPKPGDVINGYRFKGGNPSDRNNWERVA